jgi:hypothetical protein
MNNNEGYMIDVISYMDEFIEHIIDIGSYMDEFIEYMIDIGSYMDGSYMDGSYMDIYVTNYFIYVIYMLHKFVRNSPDGAQYSFICKEN